MSLIYSIPCTVIKWHAYMQKVSASRWKTLFILSSAPADAATNLTDAEENAFLIWKKNLSTSTNKENAHRF